jgi:hypothetical protein
LGELALIGEAECLLDQLARALLVGWWGGGAEPSAALLAESAGIRILRLAARTSHGAITSSTGLFITLRHPTGATPERWP